MKFEKYQHVERLGTDETDGILNGDVYIFSKLDGTNTSIYLNDKGRREVLSAWRNRKLEEITHPFLNEKIPIGLIPYTQAMLFARILRGDLDQYPPFIWR